MLEVQAHNKRGKEMGKDRGKQREQGFRSITAFIMGVPLEDNGTENS